LKKSKSGLFRRGSRGGDTTFFRLKTRTATSFSFASIIFYRSEGKVLRKHEGNSGVR
jgi:hypothetical protein